MLQQAGLTHGVTGFMTDETSTIRASWRHPSFTQRRVNLRYWYHSVSLNHGTHTLITYDYAY